MAAPLGSCTKPEKFWLRAACWACRTPVKKGTAINSVESHFFIIEPSECAESTSSEYSMKPYTYLKVASGSLPARRQSMDWIRSRSVKRPIAFHSQLQISKFGLRFNSADATAHRDCSTIKKAGACAIILAAFFAIETRAQI